MTDQIPSRNACQQMTCEDEAIHSNAEYDSLLSSKFNVALNFDSSKETPMDVDSPGPSSPPLPAKQPRRRNIKRNARRKDFRAPDAKQFTQRKERRGKLCLAIIIAAVTSIVFFALFCCYNIFEATDDADAPQKIENELKSELLFQDEVVRLIVKNLRCVNASDECRRILPFVGSTGVGKTFAVNIIKKHFHRVHEIGSVKLVDARERERVAKAIDVGRCNLVVIDDLKSQHVLVVLGFVYSLPSEARCLIVVPIFNVQETDDGVVHTIRYDEFASIPAAFETTGFGHESVRFNAIEEKLAEIWLRRVLTGRSFDASVVSTVLRQHDVEYYGLKGIEAKVNLLLS